MVARLALLHSFTHTFICSKPPCLRCLLSAPKNRIKICSPDSNALRGRSSIPTGALKAIRSKVSPSTAEKRSDSSTSTLSTSFNAMLKLAIMSARGFMSTATTRLQ
ncbi:hypothetical protein D3C80_1552580 [compost metagenome]